jgi:hypothetical protein
MGQILQSRKDQTQVVPVLPTTPNIKKRAQDISKKMKIPKLLTKVCTYRTQKIKRQIDAHA